MAHTKLLLNPDAIKYALTNAPQGGLAYPLRRRPAGDTLPGILVYGNANTGKTSLMRAFPGAIYYGFGSSAESVHARYGVKFPMERSWADQAWSQAGTQGYGTPAPMPLLGFRMLAHRLSQPTHKGMVVILDEFTNWQAQWKERGIDGRFFTANGKEDGGAAWAALGADLRGLHTAAAANQVTLVVLGHQQDSGVKEFLGKTSHVTEGMAGPSHKQNAQFATLFGLRVQATSQEGRTFLSGQFDKGKAVQVDRTGVMQGSGPYPGNLGAILRCAGFTVDRTHKRVDADGALAEVPHAPQETLVQEIVAAWLKGLGSLRTPEQIENSYRHAKARVKQSAFGADAGLVNLLYEDIRDTVETIVMHYEAEAL